MLKKIDEYLTNKIKLVVESMKSARDEYCSDKFLLPDIDRSRLLGCSIQRTHENLIPKGVQGVAMDTAVSAAKNLQGAYNISGEINDIIYTHYATQCFIGFQACSILTQNWLINKCCTLPPKDAIRPDYELSYKTVDMEELDKDFLEEIKALSDDEKKFKIKKKAQIFAEKKRQFGQVLAMPVIDGVDYSLPFNLDAITPGSYKGMSIIDPVWYRPELDAEAANNPVSLRFFKPTYFGMPDGTRVHSSWTIFGVNGEVPDILKPTYYYGGYPVPQLVYERAYAAEKVANEAPMLAMSKRLLYMDANLNTYLLNQQKGEADVKAFSYFRDNWGVVIKRPDQTIGQLDTSLTDYDEVTMSQFQLAAAASGVPATKLLETQPKGFNSTGDYEDDQYKLLLTSIENEDYIPLLAYHYMLLSKSKYEVERYFTINFNEIDTPTEKERAEINEIKSRTDSNYINSGVISADECRDSLVKDANSGYNNLTGEAPEDDLGFENEEGGGESSQDPFRSVSRSGVPVSSCGEQDEQGTQLNIGDVRVSVRNSAGARSGSSTGAADEWEDNKHPRDKDGKFASSNSIGGGKNSQNSLKLKESEISSPKTYQLQAKKYRLNIHSIKQLHQKAKKFSKKISKIGKVNNPDIIADTKRAKPMSFDDADNGRANPEFQKGEDKYTHNCQSSVVAHEARMRGYNVKAAPRGANDKTTELANNPFEAWTHPLTGRKCKGEKLISSRPYDLYITLDSKVKQGQRYHFSFVRSVGGFDVGHIITVDKDENGNLRFYDPQSNRIFIGDEVMEYIENTNMYLGDTEACPQILRIDNKNFNPYYMDDVLQKY